MKMRFWEKKPKEIPIPSTVFQNQLFDESHKIISRNANYLLVTNGVLLSIFLVSQGKNLLSTVSQIPDLKVTTSLGYSFNVTASPTPAGSLYFTLLYVIFFGSTLISMISCFGCFNLGLYPRMDRRRSVQELVTREKEALRYYRVSIISLFFGFIALLNFNLAAVIGVSNPLYTTIIFAFTAVSFVGFILAIIFVKLFSEFEDEEISS